MAQKSGTSVKGEVLILSKGSYEDQYILVAQAYLDVELIAAYNIWREHKTLCERLDRANHVAG